jgi:hypothetical protein
MARWGMPSLVRVGGQVPVTKIRPLKLPAPKLPKTTTLRAPGAGLSRLTTPRGIQLKALGTSSYPAAAKFPSAPSFFGARAR